MLSELSVEDELLFNNVLDVAKASFDHRMKFFWINSQALTGTGIFTGAVYIDSKILALLTTRCWITSLKNGQ